MPSFSVSSATYTPTTDGNPLVYVQGNISHFSGYHPNFGVVSNFSGPAATLLYWANIEQANIAGGQAAVQSLVAVAFLNSWQYAPFRSLPITPAANIPAPAATGTSAVCTEALVSPWSN